MNEAIKTKIETSLQKIRNALSDEKFLIIQNEFKRMHNNEVSVSRSYLDLIRDNIIERSEELIEDSFYNIGYLIGMPTRGPTNSLRASYKEELTQFPDLSLGEYQHKIMDEVYVYVIGEEPS